MRQIKRFLVLLIITLVIFSYALSVICVLGLIIKNQELAQILSAFAIGGFIGNINIDNFYNTFGV